MVILGIETSCDETAAALVKNGTEIISNVIASSQELHIKTKGVIPEVAAREQVGCIIPVIKEALNHCSIVKLLNFSKKKPEDFIDAIAVTVGPGLIGSLLVGVETAKTLAYVWNKPIVPVNHLVGHIYCNFVNRTNHHPGGTMPACRQGRASASLQPVTTEVDNKPPRRWQGNDLDSSEVNVFKEIFPAIVLIVSGGHTELLLMKNHGKFKWLGGTRDDAAGECFDKCTRILGLPYPGGPAIAASAAKFNIKHLTFNKKLPRPMIDQENFDFSFSGLKTALFNFIKNNETMPALSEALHQMVRGEVEGKQSNNFIPYFAFEVQEAITDVLVSKTIKAAEKYKVNSIIIGGGVTANQRLREKFRDKAKNFNLLMPKKGLSTDNAVGIASAAFFNYNPTVWSKITADSNLEIFY